METLRRGRLGVLHRSFGSTPTCLDMYTQVREEEQIISPPFTRSQEDVPVRRRKKRKQGEDSALIGQPPLGSSIRKQWQEARANRRMQFKVGNYRDGSWESNIRVSTGTIKVDWIQLPVEPYLAALPTLQQCVIAGVFRQKGAAPWITRAEKLFFFLSNGCMAQRRSLSGRSPFCQH